MRNMRTRLYLKSLIFLFGLFFIQGCATVRSPSAVPAGLIYKAQIPDASNIRLVIDYLNPDLTLEQFKNDEYQLNKKTL